MYCDLEPRSGVTILSNPAGTIIADQLWSFVKDQTDSCLTIVAGLRHTGRHQEYAFRDSNLIGQDGTRRHVQI